MEMVRHQNPGIQTRAAGLADTFRKPLQESLSIIIVTKNVASFNPSRHDMINQSGYIQSRLSWHIIYLVILPAPPSE
jgi:hypothetical protein